MSNSSDVTAGTGATAAQYNNLRKDVLDPATAHSHKVNSESKLEGWNVIYSAASVTNYTWTLPTTGTKQFKVKIKGNVNFLDSGASAVNISILKLTGAAGGVTFSNTTASSFNGGVGFVSYVEFTLDLERGRGEFFYDNNTLNETYQGSITNIGTLAKMLFSGYNLIIEELNTFTN